MKNINYLGFKSVFGALIAIFLIAGAYTGVKKIVSPANIKTNPFEIPAGEINESPNINSDNYTKQYRDALQEIDAEGDILNKQRIEAFINENQGPLLPALNPESIQVLDAADQNAVHSYIQAVSSNHNPLITAVSSAEIEEAYYLHSRSNNSETILTVIGTLEQNLAALYEIKVPVSVLNTHMKLLAASESLLNNVKLLEKSNNRFIDGLMAAKNIEDLGEVFEELSQEFKKLKST